MRTAFCHSRRTKVCIRTLDSKIQISDISQRKIKSLRANYIDRGTVACSRNWCQLSWIEGATWSTRRIPTAIFSIS
jgi:hypothetical protein